MNSTNLKNEQKTPRVSVLMSVHNGEKYLKEAIESILTQTFADFEFIIVDDASTDQTSDILGLYVKMDSRILVKKNETKLGLTKSLNIGLKHARGIYTARMDADDISLPKRLQVQTEFLDTHKEITCVGSETVIIDSNDQVIGKKTPPANPEILKFCTMLKNQITHSSSMFRTMTIIENGGYDEQKIFAQDYKLWSQLMHKGYQFSNIPETLIKYRLLNSSITQGRHKKTAYESAQKTMFENLTRYMSISQKEFTALVESLHMHNVRSLHQAFVTQKILATFRKKFFQKECVSQKNQKVINKYIRGEQIGSFRWYAMRRFGILYKVLASIKNSI